MAEFTGSPSICATSFACIENKKEGIYSRTPVASSSSQYIPHSLLSIQLYGFRTANTLHCDTHLRSETRRPHPLCEAGERGSTSPHPSVLAFLFRHFDMHVTVHSHLKKMSSRREENPSRSNTLSNYKVRYLHWKSCFITAAFTNTSPCGLQTDATTIDRHSTRFWGATVITS